MGPFRAMKRIVWAALLASAGSIIACSVYRMNRALVAAPVSHRDPQIPILDEDEDLAVACLVWGELMPGFEELSDQQLDVCIRVITRVLSSYGRADFDAFLALRAADLEAAQLSQTSKTESFRDLARQLGVEEEVIPHTWLGALRSFWKAYYAEPPVARWIPEVTRVHHGASSTAELAGWEESFEDLRALLSGSVLEHHLVVPHRASLDALIATETSAQWFDLVLGYETRQLESGRLLARFVRIGDETNEWFLHRAVTALETRTPHSSYHRQLIL